MNNFKSNLRSCLLGIMPFALAAAAGLGIVGYIGAVMWFLSETLHVHLITGYIVGALTLPFPCALICAAWKTWGRDWYARLIGE